MSIVLRRQYQQRKLSSAGWNKLLTPTWEPPPSLELQISHSQPHIKATEKLAYLREGVECLEIIGQTGSSVHHSQDL